MQNVKPNLLTFKVFFCTITDVTFADIGRKKVETDKQFMTLNKIQDSKLRLYNLKKHLQDKLFFDLII